MSDLRDFIENAAGAINNNTFGSLTSRLFVRDMEEINRGDYERLIDDAKMLFAAHDFMDSYVVHGDGTIELCSMYEHSVDKAARDYIEKKMQEFEDEDESEVIDYEEENPKTVREVML